MARYGLKINRFDGGLNTQVSPLTGDVNESPDLLNVEFDNWGAVGTRNGISTLQAISTGPVNLLANYKSDTYNQLVAVCDGSVYVKDGTNNFSVAAQGQDVMTPQTRIVGNNYQNYLWMANGSQMYKYNGSTVTRWGVSAPSNPIYAETFGAISSNFTAVSNSYMFTSVDQLGNESYSSSAYTSTYFCNPFATLPLTLKITPAPVSHGVAEVDIYRLRHGVDADYRLLTAVSSDCTSFDDNQEDLAAITITPDVENSPPPLSVFIPHVGYLFGANESSNPTRLYFSKINEPSSWDPEDYIRVGDGDGYPIRALAIMGANLIICKDDGQGEGSIWTLYTPDAEPNNWQLSRFNSSYGSVAPKAAARFSQYIMVLNKSGVYNLAEAGVGDTQSEALSYNIEPSVLNFANDFLKNSVAVTFDNKTYLSVPGNPASRINDTLYLYDYIKGRDEVNKYSGAWSKFNMSLSDMATWKGSLYGGTYDGKIVQIDSTSHSDDSTAISSYFQTMAIYGAEEHRDNDKVWRKIRLTVDTPGNWDMTCSYSPDFYNTAGDSTKLNLNPGGAYWGDTSSNWGITSWGPQYVRRTFTINLNTVVSKSIMFKFSTNTVNQYWKVYDMQLEYNLRGVR